MQTRYLLVSLIAVAAVAGACGSGPATPAPSGRVPASEAIAPTGGPASPGGSGSPAPAASASPSPASSAAPSAASDPWPTANVALPAAVTTAPSLLPGYSCHPCHFLAEDQFLGVGASPAGLIAVGVQEPPAQATVFSSTDGMNWQPLPGFTAATGTTAIAVASNGTRTVIVGLDPSGATAWASGGGPWTQAPRQADLLVPYAAGGMTAVTAFGGGFVAAGYRDDPLHNTASAAAWRSTDGLTWRADDAAGVFAGGRIWGLAARGGTLVAVGTNGDPNYGPVGAWVWTQAAGWRRARVEPDDGGAMKAVTATPSGFVAVGLNGHDDGAMAWTSPDGLAWTAAPDQPAFHYGQQPMRMQSVVSVSDGLVVGGWRSDVAKGSSVTWTSVDGVTWQPPVWETAFSGGQIAGVATIGHNVVAVGRTGYPDWNQATIWVSPAP